MLNPVLAAGQGFAAAVRDMSAQWRAFMGIPQGGPLEYESLTDFAKAPADEAWVYSCVHRLATSAQSVPLRIYVKDGKDRIPVEDADTAQFRAQFDAGTQAQQVLDVVNPYTMNGTDLKLYTTAGRAVWGASYWLKVRGKFGGPPQELYWLPATDLKPNKDPNIIGAVASYTYQPQMSGTQVFDRRDIVPFLRFNMRDQTQPLSPLSAARTEVSVNRMAALYNQALLKNGSVPPGAWILPENAEVSPQEVGLIRRALRMLTGPANAGKIPVLPQGIKWQQLGLAQKDAEWLAARKVSRMTVCAVLGVPLLLAGDDENPGPYAYSRDIWKMFWLGTMIPDLDSQAQTITGWFLPDFDPTNGLAAAFDYSDVEALKEPFKDQVVAWNGMADRTIVTPNEYRRHFKLGADVPWGDKPILSTKLAAQTSDTGQSANDDETQTQDAGDSSDPTQPAPTDAPAPAENDAATAAATVKALRHLYALPPVQAYQSNPSLPLDADAIVGHPVSVAIRDVMAEGIRRHYNAAQIADGVPNEHYAGIRGTP